MECEKKLEKKFTQICRVQTLGKAGEVFPSTTALPSADRHSAK